MAELNIARGTESLAIFEVGKVYFAKGTVPASLPRADKRPDEQTIAALHKGVPSQPQHVGIILAGQAGPTGVLG
ncbi:hypothetical protein, partial [Streptococcus agalactiae]|uniref:hypothetical protein n=1 Tax=Streptococcus agalactiae TaxID=1311 RepID=UPI0034DF7692